MTSHVRPWLFCFLLLGCSKTNEVAPSEGDYFPRSTTTDWETVSLASLGWNEANIPDLRSFLTNNNTRAFIILKNGRIAMEEYYGTQLGSNTPFDKVSPWYWASAGKTLTSALVGIAESQGKINLQAKTSTYLGNGWTALTQAQEDQITVFHQITMTTGLDDGISDPDCTDKSCLIYKADAGTRWAYHNAPYTLLDKVIGAATGSSLNTYLNTQLRDMIGMDGQYIQSGYNNVYYSTPRSMARFGLLLLNHGKWDQTVVIPDAYVSKMIVASQTLNLSYGYLTWLNGKTSYMAPGSPFVVPGSIAPHAPPDMFAAMGKNGQLINVVPSQNLVVIRMGDAPDNSMVPYTFQDEMWKLLDTIITK